MSDPTDHLATVRAALDLMLRAWPGSLDVRRFVDDTGNDAAAVIDKATGETIAICDNEDRDDHAAPAEDAAAIVALRNAAPAIAALADECERLRATTEEREADMHQRIRLGYDKTVADAWRAEVVKRDERIATLEAELAQARAHCDVQDRGNGHYQIAPSPTSPPAARPVFAAVSDEDLGRAVWSKYNNADPAAWPNITIGVRAMWTAAARAVRAKLGAAEVTEERVKAALCEHFKYEGHRNWSADARAILAYLRASAAKGG